MKSAYDLAIIGAGPGGLSAAINAQRNNLNYILLEKSDHVADTIFCYPKKKDVMAEPSKIPRRGDLWLEPSKREQLLDRWTEIAAQENLNVSLNNAMQSLARADGVFQIKTNQTTLSAKHVIIAIGTQSNPRRLDVPGEDQPHVSTRLIDPDLYHDQDIVVVGGGDSAAEAALAVASNNRLTMAVRTPEFTRIKPNLEKALLELAARNEISIHFQAAVESISADSVRLKLPASTLEVPAQVIIAKVGTLPPRVFLEKCGVDYRTSDPNSPPRLSTSYETSMEGLYLVGAVAGVGADLIKHAINQGFEVVEHICGREVEPADEELLKGTLHFLSGPVSQRISTLREKTPIFAEVGEELLREILLFSNFHRFAPGDVVFRQHDFSESIYLILEGTVEVSIKNAEGLERSVATLSAGEFFGEMSLISGRRRSATVIATTQAFMWEVSRKPMLKLIQTSPPVKKVVDHNFVIHAFQTHVFPNLEARTLAPLVANAEVRRFEKGARIVKQGEIGDDFYFIRSGIVSVKHLQEGREIVVAYLSAGQHFGEGALLRDEPRMATVTAVDRVEVIRVPKQDFLKHMETAPQSRERIVEEINRRRMKNLEVSARPELAELSRFITGEEVVVSDNVLLIDENLCIHCDNCVKACESVHDDGQTRIKRTGVKFANILVANSCRHCENALCMTDCPPGDAIVRDANGEVYIRDNCIACGNCASNCPYDNIFMVQPKEKSSFFDWIKQSAGMPKSTTNSSDRKIPVKCDLCRNLDTGPACVHNCPTGAVLRLTSEEYYEKINSLVAERKDVFAP